MPDITLRYKQEELEDFIRKMLAAKGLQPVDRIEFRPRIVNGEPQSFDVIIDCAPGPLLDECPMCQTKLSNGAPVPAPPVRVETPGRKSVRQQIDEEEGHAVVETIKEAVEYAEERDYPAGDFPIDPDTQEEQDPALIDPELGETFDPPAPGEGAPSVTVSTTSSTDDEEEGGGSMKSLLAANRRLTAQRERELAERKKQSGGSHMAGESTRPPKPGEGL
jgi:hypothetical protein